MGTLTYDVIHKVEFDDRALTHLQVVIATKLRRGEAFNFSWVIDPSEGSGRTTIWMHPAIPLVYEYDDSRRPKINRGWIESLLSAANSTGGLILMQEPSEAETNVSPPAGGSAGYLGA